jgi:hypothetical protein
MTTPQTDVDHGSRPPPRSDFRLSLRMLLVIIAGLVLVLLIEHRRRQAAKETARANASRAEAARAAAEVAARAAQQAQEQIPSFLDAEEGSGAIDGAASKRKATAK